jgi:site-specific DNA-methyltransferase (adenine-specific)
MSYCDIICGEALAELRKLPPDSAHACVTDPPYGLKFMGKDWDRGVPGSAYWAEALRVCRPGAHLLAFGGTRTFHRLACAIEDAGWEIRDTLMWVYGSGFPKSLDVGKAFDKAAGAKGEVVGVQKVDVGMQSGHMHSGRRSEVVEREVRAPATDEAREWRGWGTALKPAWEPILLARRPLDGTVVENVRKWGCGALNVDGCRVGEESTVRTRRDSLSASGWASVNRSPVGGSEAGRWPANVVHDGSEEVLAGFPRTRSGSDTVKRESGADRDGNRGAAYGAESRPAGSPMVFYGDEGSAARFFYCAKPSPSEREGNPHPTVKPLALMEWLLRLVSREGDTVVDPFAGSGTTGVAAYRLGRNAVLIDKSRADYETMKARMAKAGAALEPI